jgi:hypothetical protein
MSTVNHPAHYNQGSIETIDLIESVVGNGFSIGCVIKYVSRYQYKNNPLEDLKKAQWYLERLIRNEEIRLKKKDERLSKNGVN